ncbi:hypothetical protein GCM10027586_03040 [Kineococcus gypseus]|uniref:hypothetical protein n=1 Tax=Kineococcus gypseus TaxID=1637102 RepID=UPI003D7C46B2
MSTILITGTGTGRLAARTLAAGGHQVYASMRDPDGRNGHEAADVRGFGRENGYRLEVVELDVLSE